jgi:hypothetical protein
MQIKFKLKVQIKKVKWTILLFKMNQKLLKVHQVKVLFLSNKLKKKVKNFRQSPKSRVIEIQKKVDLMMR